MEESVKEIEGKSFGKFQWFLVILIPLLFAIAIMLVLSTVKGVNVFEKAKEFTKNIPFISQTADKETDASAKEYEQKIYGLQANMENSKAEIVKLETMVENRDKELEVSDIEKQRLEQEINELRASQAENRRAFKDIIKTYEKMSPAKSAKILSAMEKENAVKILSTIKADVLASILEKMEPSVAAAFTERLSVIGNSSE